MAGSLPSIPDTFAADEPSSRVIGLEDDKASDSLSALSSGTAHCVLATLHKGPTNATKLAECVDTPLQNIQYHLRKLDDVGLIEVVDIICSEKGHEVEVYAPADRPFVVIAIGEETRMGLASMLPGLLGGVVVLALLSVLVQQAATRGIGVLGGDGSTVESAGVGVVSTMAAEAAPAAAQIAPPGFAFLAGDPVILPIVAAVQFAWW